MTLRLCVAIAELLGLRARCLFPSLFLAAPIVVFSQAITFFDLPAQPLAESLKALGAQTHTNVLVAPELVDGKQAPALKASLTVDEAMKELLRGTGITYKFLSDRTLVLAVIPPSVSYKRRALPVTGSVDSANNGAAMQAVENKSFWDRFRLAQADQGKTASTGPAEESLRTYGSEGEKLEEIIVTAQKREERLHDVPVPMTAIAGDALTRTNQLRLEDYYSMVPGLSLGLSGDSGAPTISIRGISTSARTNPTVGIVVDEVSYGASALAGSGVIVNPADIDPGDLARIEVLRGPQGTLYGAASIGGLLKFVTVDPSAERRGGRVQVGTSTVSHGGTGYSVRGNINLPLSDTLAIRASAFTARDPGFIDNASTGKRDVNNFDSDGSRLSAMWRPSDRFSLKLSALVQDNERLGTDNVDTALGRENFRQAFLPGTGQYTRKTEAYSATMVGEFGSVEWTSATGYSTDEKIHNLDFTEIGGGVFAAQAAQFFPGTNNMSSFQDTRVEKLTQELRASIPLGERVNWLVGGFYTDENYNWSAHNDATDPAGKFVGTVIAFGYDPAGYEESAAFSTLTVDLTDRWDVQIGGRFSDHRQNSRLSLSGPSVGGGTIHLDPIRSSTQAFTYLLTPRFRVSPQLMIYARLASGFRPGGPNSLCGQYAEIPCEFDPDETQNYDIGLKAQVLGGALSIDTSVYYIDWKDIQLQGVQIAGGGAAYTGNVARARSQGVELAIESRRLAGLSLSGWVAYNDATLRAPFPVADFNPAGQSGDRLPYASRLSGNLSLDQEFPLWGLVTGSIGGSLSYVGDRKGGFGLQISGGARETFPAYTRLDLNGRIRYDTWALNIFVNNVTDKRGVLRGGLDSEFTPSYFTYIEPRVFGLSLSKDF